MNDTDNSNFKSISPSAMSLLETRSYTSIPFAKESLKIISPATSNELKEAEQLPEAVILRIMHFETRYRSIDKGLKELGNNNILEFSSGFSFRGLDFCKNSSVHYIDTDLPNIIEIKKNIVFELTKRYCDYQPSNLKLLAMNALNEEEFFNTIAMLGSGPVSIVNEGLLMYFNEEQKEKIMGIIHKILTQYGGYWITTDIYRKGEIEGRNIDKFYKQKGKEFLEKHNVEDNKFPSFEKAEEFFLKNGFEIYKKIEIEKKELSSSKLLHQNTTLSNLNLQGKQKSRETWILKPL